MDNHCGHAEKYDKSHKVRLILGTLCFIFGHWWSSLRVDRELSPIEQKCRICNALQWRCNAGTWHAGNAPWDKPS